MGKSICSKIWCYVWERPLYEKTALWVSVTATDPHPHSISVPPSSFLPILLLSHVFFFFLLLPHVSSLWAFLCGAFFEVGVSSVAS